MDGRYRGAVKFLEIRESLPVGSLIRVYLLPEGDERTRRYAQPSERGTLYAVCDRGRLHEWSVNALGSCIDDVAALLNVQTSPQGWSRAGFVRLKSYGVTHDHFVKVPSPENA